MRHLMLTLIFSILLGIVSSDERVQQIPVSDEERQLLMIYRKGTDAKIQFLVNDQHFDTYNGLYPRLWLNLKPGQSYSIAIQSQDKKKLEQIEIYGGWVWPSDPQNALKKGSDFFYYTKKENESSRWYYVDAKSYEKIYDEYQRPQYHFSAPRNWINDPNGAIYMNGNYHLFYQYNPYDTKWGNMFWGHVVSTDGIFWRQLPIALFPGSKVNQSAVGGAFSGGAWNDKGNMILYFTDSVEAQDFIEIQNYTISRDTIHFKEVRKNSFKIQKFQTIISQRPEKTTKDFRDPTVVFNQQTQQYQLFLGTNYDSAPSVIQYVSDDPKGPWEFDSVIYSAPYLPSTTIECPNKFYATDKITGEALVVLLFSINDIKIKSSYPLYVLGKEDEHGRFYNTTDVRRLDYGGHFYATQVFTGTFGEDAEAITWMQNWDLDKKYLGNDNFSCAFTLIRRMFLRNGILFQLPIESTKNLRKEDAYIDEIGDANTFIDMITEKSEIYMQGTSVNDWKIKFIFQNATTEYIEILFNSQLGIVVMNVKEKQSYRSYETTNLVNYFGYYVDFTIYLDRAAIEVFVNDGEATFSERFLGNQNSDDGIMLELTAQKIQGAQWSLQVWELLSFYSQNS